MLDRAYYQFRANVLASVVKTASSFRIEGYLAFINITAPAYDDPNKIGTRIDFGCYISCRTRIDLGTEALTLTKATAHITDRQGGVWVRPVYNFDGIAVRVKEDWHHLRVYVDNMPPANFAKIQLSLCDETGKIRTTLFQDQDATGIGQTPAR